MNDARIRIEIRPPLGYRDGWRIYTYRIADADYPRRPRFTLGDAADGGPEMTADYGRIERDADRPDRVWWWWPE
ncbi:MAG: hypothetical protein OXH10_10445 [bacterium]|nr:hypothetical protein [bacterium]MDE0644608.1 hypothetical protein [bacterium]